jgi:hypothetical protein
MVGVQHVKGASEKTKEMMIDMVQMTHESEKIRRRKGKLESPLCIPPSGRGPTYLDGLVL